MSARMSKQERVWARRRFLQEQENHAHIEARIAELGGVSDAQLKNWG